MKRLKLKNRFQANATILPNEFIDHYMVSANGEFVKVYLLLLRYLNEPGSVLTVSMIADCLNNTENDVLRAFRYWESTGLLRLTKDADGSISGIELLSSDTEDASAFSPGSSSQELTDSMEEPASVMNVFGTVPDESSGTFESSPDSSFSGTSSEPIAMDAFRSQKELKSLFFIAEQYLGKTLSHTDVDMITYFYNELHMSSSLIEYLLETCVESGHKSMHYIQKVALSWCERHIKTVSEAKASSMAYNKNCYSILGAFGIKGRAPAPSEMEYIKRWTSEYGFSLDLILNACARTMNAIHQPSFDYTESILKKWLEQSVKNIQDIETLDAGFIREKEAREKERREKELQRKSAAKITPAPTKFNNFENRSYDMSDLERKLLQQ